MHKWPIIVRIGLRFVRVCTAHETVRSCDLWTTKVPLSCRHLYGYRKNTTQYHDMVWCLYRPALVQTRYTNKSLRTADLPNQVVNTVVHDVLVGRTMRTGAKGSGSNLFQHDNKKTSTKSEIHKNQWCLRKSGRIPTSTLLNTSGMNPTSIRHQCPPHLNSCGWINKSKRKSGGYHNSKPGAGW